jgi:hypothetical protein
MFPSHAPNKATTPGQPQAIAQRGDPHLKIPGERRERMRTFPPADARTPDAVSRRS